MFECVNSQKIKRFHYLYFYFALLGSPVNFGRKEREYFVSRFACNFDLIERLIKFIVWPEHCHWLFQWFSTLKNVACIHNMHMYEWLSNGQFDLPMNIYSWAYAFLSEMTMSEGRGKKRKIRKEMKEMRFRIWKEKKTFRKKITTIISIREKWTW